MNKEILINAFFPRINGKQTTERLFVQIYFGIKTIIKLINIKIHHSLKRMMGTHGYPFI